MKKLLNILWIILIALILSAVIMIVNGIPYGKYVESFSDFATILFSTVTIILVIISLLKQSIVNLKGKAENHFFNMLNYHSANVRSLRIKHIKKTKSKNKVEGRRAFVVFSMQLIRLLEVVEIINTDLELNLTKNEIIDIAYIAFYYGIDDEQQERSINKLSMYNKPEEITRKLIDYKNKLKKEEKINIGRTNQTSLSSYFRNIFNTIKFIDKSTILSEKEKHKYIKIYRAQFSNPELVVLFFNIVSRFGLKWKYNDFILNYEIIKNIPFDYCGNYHTNDFFIMKYEEDELKTQLTKKTFFTTISQYIKKICKCFHSL